MSCNHTVLNCTAAGQAIFSIRTGRPAVVFLDPELPLSAPRIQCGSANGGASELDTLVVFYGHDCPIWRPDNAAGCFWNATVQVRQC